MDKEFAEAFKEDLELNEMKWEVGVVYHQEFKNGDKVYFRADSVQKNKRWKGLSVDEFGGRQKKAKSASADEKQQGWETTPKNEIPKGLKEEVEVAEADKEALKRALAISKWKKAGGKIDKQPDNMEKWWGQLSPEDQKRAANIAQYKKEKKQKKEEVEIDEGKFKKGDIVIPNMGPHKGEKHKIIHDFGDGSYNITPQKHSRFIKYKQGAAKAKENQLKLVKEEVEIDEAKSKLPPHLAKFFDKDGNLKKDAAARVAKGREKINWIDVTPKGYGPKEEVEEASTYRDRAKDDEKKKKKHFAFGGKKKSRHGESGYGKGEEVKVEATRMPMSAPFKLEEEIFYWYIIRGDLANGKIVYAGNEKQVKLKRHDPKFGDGHVMTKSRKMKKVGEKWKKSEGVNEDVEIEEKKSATGYELYHKDFSSAMQHAYAHAKKKGFVIDPKEIDDKVATGPKKPSSGKTNRYSLKAGRKKVEIQVANLDNKRYELNMYIEGTEVDTTDNPLETRRKKYIELNKKDVLNPLNKVKEALTRMKERSMVEKPENKSSIEEQDDYYAPWLDAEARKVEHQWPRMKTKLRVKWLAQIKVKAKKEDMSQEVLDKILDQYGLTKFPKEKVWHEVQKIKPKWKKMSTAERTRWVDDLDDIAKKTHTSHADVEAILDDAKLKIKEEVEIDEGTALQVKMALDDVGLKGKWKNGKVYVKKRDVKKAEKALKGNVIYRGKPPIVVGENFFNKIREVIDLKKSSMGAVIKDFQDSDAPQFQGKSDKKRKEMAIAAKLSKEEKEETDDPKSKKKDKINLKPKMDEKMAKTYKEMLKHIKDKKSTEEVKEAVTDSGVEYGEQDWDAHYRLDHAAPNLGVNYAEFHEQELEGPYQVDGEAYFFDRKVGSWYSVESEDYVDEEKSKELSFRYVKDGMYKPQFSN